jgi:hypothetical protein
MLLLFRAVLTATEEKNVLMQFQFSFNVWLSSIVPALRISKEAFEQIERIGHRLDPDFSVPDMLLPSEKKARQRWLAFRQALQDELESEIFRLSREDLKAHLRAHKEFQLLDLMEKSERSHTREIENPGQRKELRAEVDEAEQKFKEKFFRGVESLTEEQAMKLSTMMNELADRTEPLRQMTLRYRRRALERIAARKKPTQPMQSAPDC